MVDADDEHVLAAQSWRVQKSLNTSYVVYAKRFDGRKVVTMLHRVIMDVSSRGMLVDHVNRCGLDNRRCNLRLANHAENMRNRKQHKSSSLMFKGIEERKNRKTRTFRAVLRIDGVRIRGKYRLTQEDAAKDYDNLAARHHGQFASPNIHT